MCQRDIRDEHPVEPYKFKAHPIDKIACRLFGHEFTRDVDTDFYDVCKICGLRIKRS